MFELLLQADEALANGALDQAEQTYWQLIELDPTNAIAAAGLARVALQRGDKRLARSFADRALGIDPDNVAARKVLDALDRVAAPTEPEPTGLPLVGAEPGGAERRRPREPRPSRSPRRRGGARAGARKAKAAEDAGGGRDGRGRGRSGGGDEVEPARRGRSRCAAGPGRTSSSHCRRSRCTTAVRPAGLPRRQPPPRRVREPVRPSPPRHAGRPALRAGGASQGRRRCDPFSQAETAAAIEAIDAARRSCPGRPPGRPSRDRPRAPGRRAPGVEAAGAQRHRRPEPRSPRIARPAA